MQNARNISTAPLSAIDFDASELKDAVIAKTSKLTPNELNDIIDMSDVEFAVDAFFMPSWRRAVVRAVIEGVNSEQDWAIDFVGGDV